MPPRRPRFIDRALAITLAAAVSACVPLANAAEPAHGLATCNSVLDEHAAWLEHEQEGYTGPVL